MSQADGRDPETGNVTGALFAARARLALAKFTHLHLYCRWPPQPGSESASAKSAIQRGDQLGR